MFQGHRPEQGPQGIDKQTGKLATEGDSPVVEIPQGLDLAPEYDGARETLLESGRTISQV